MHARPGCASCARNPDHGSGPPQQQVDAAVDVSHLATHRHHLHPGEGDGERTAPDLGVGGRQRATRAHRHRHTIMDVLDLAGGVQRLVVAERIKQQRERVDEPRPVSKGNDVVGGRDGNVARMHATCGLSSCLAHDHVCDLGIDTPRGDAADARQRVKHVVETLAAVDDLPDIPTRRLIEGRRRFQHASEAIRCRKRPPELVAGRANRACKQLAWIIHLDRIGHLQPLPSWHPWHAARMHWRRERGARRARTWEDTCRPQDMAGHAPVLMTALMQIDRTIDAPDLQESAPRVPLPLARVGITGVQARAVIADGTGSGQGTLVAVDASVDLGASQRGVHMSRFHEAVAAATDSDRPLPPALLAARIARAARHAQGSSIAHTRVACDLLLADRAPGSGRACTIPVHVVASATCGDDDPLRTTTSVTVAGINACPCAQELVRSDARSRLLGAGLTPEDVDTALSVVPVATHNQRGLATLLVGRIGDADLPDVPLLAAIAREAMSAHVHELLKRIDELHVVRAAHDAPRFVEDCVRELLDRALLDLRLADDDLVWASQVNHESIHAHDVSAEAGGLVGEVREWQRGSAPATSRDWLTPDRWLGC